MVTSALEISVKLTKYSDIEHTINRYVDLR